MAAYEPSEQIKKKRVVGLVEFPPYARNNYGSTTHMVATYLRRLLDWNKLHHGCDGLIIPSVTVLAGYFNCTELDVLEAFHEMRRQGYDYEIQGLDMPVCYFDLLVREPVAEHRQGTLDSIGEMFGRIWQSLRPAGTLNPTS